MNSTSTGYLQVQEGHCFVCHGPTSPNSTYTHGCAGTITPCRPGCPDFGRENNPENQKYKYCPHCGHKL